MHVINTGRDRTACNGFTLLELLLGSVISALLLAALYGVFQGALQAQSRTNARLEEYLPQGQVVALMKNDMENIAAPNDLLCGNILGRHEGDADHCSDTLEFSTTTGKPVNTLPWGEVQKVVYSLEISDEEDAGANLQLVRTVTRNLLSPQIQDQEESVVLLDAVQSLEFQYFDGQNWLEAWDSTTTNNAPPKAIRTRILLAAEPTNDATPKSIDIVCEVCVRPGPREVAARGKTSSGWEPGLWCLGFGVLGCCVRRRKNESREGMVLVIVLWIVLGLASVILLFAEEMRMEYRASANSIAAVEAGQAVESARRYLGYIFDNYTAPGMLPESDVFQVEDVPVGKAAFWVIGRSSEEQSGADTPTFGVVDEASKLNLNTATREMLEMLPNMTPDVAAAILDWRSSAESPQPDGAESQVYMAGNPSYQCKNAPFESVEELRWVRGVTDGLLDGKDTNRNGILDPDEEESDAMTTASTLLSTPGGTAWRGLLDYVTVWSREPNRRANGLARVDVRRPKNTEFDSLLHEKLGAARAAQIETAVNAQAANFKSVLEFYLVGKVTRDEASLLEDTLTADDGSYIVGRVNVNTAPREVLICISGIGQKYVDDLIAVRQTKAVEELDSVIWVSEVLDLQSAIAAGPYITTRSFQISADVAAVGRNGHALRRAWMVFDTMEDRSTVIYRVDTTYLGWPLGAAWRDELDKPAQEDGRSPGIPGKETT